MKRLLRVLVFAPGALLGLAGPAAAAQSVTKQLPGVPCSVTSSFTFSSSARTMNGAGGVSCARGVGQRTLNVVPQVQKVVNGRPLWFNISLAGRYQGPTTVNPLRLSADRQATIDHVYRVLAYGRVSLPDGRTAWATSCSGSCIGSPELSIRATYRYAPQLPVTVRVGASPCFLTQVGPEFTLVNGSYVVSYAGRVVCPTRGIRKSLDITAEVAGSGVNRGKHFTVTGSRLSAGASTRDPVALDTARTAFMGIGYRTRASAKVTYASRTYSTTVTSATVAP